MVICFLYAFTFLSMDHRFRRNHFIGWKIEDLRMRSRAYQLQVFFVLFEFSNASTMNKPRKIPFIYRPEVKSICSLFSHCVNPKIPVSISKKIPTIWKQRYPKINRNRKSDFHRNWQRECDQLHLMLLIQWRFAMSLHSNRIGRCSSELKMLSSKCYI